MNKTFPKSYIMLPLELTLDYIVLNYCLLDTNCFTNAENNFIRITSLHDRRLTALNITAQLNQCREKMSHHPLWVEDSETGLYGRIVVKTPLSRNQNNVKRLQKAKAYKDWTNRAGE